MLLISRIVTRITYTLKCEALGLRLWFQSMMPNHCASVGASIRAMPSSSLNWIRTDQQTVMAGAWQRWTGLPQGAPSGPGSSTSRPCSTPSAHSVPCMLRPCDGQRAHAGFSHALAGPRTPVIFGCGQLEDGVPHEALSPANSQLSIHHKKRRART